MNFEKMIARDGADTLKVNDLYVYSKYRPLEDAERYIRSEFNSAAEGYLLIGLGLGYHLYALFQKNQTKPIIVYCLDEEEIRLFQNSTVYNDLTRKTTIKITNDLRELQITADYQIIIPHVWMQVMEKKHPLYSFLADIKMKQMTYKQYAPLMEDNFMKNVQLQEFHLTNHRYEKKVACLVASGPSLNETKKWLAHVKDDVFILCVGSALKILLNEGIQPDAVIITDPKHSILSQLRGCSHDGLLYYLSTASSSTVSEYQGPRCILLQEGYSLAEQSAKNNTYPLLETGGSVATTGFSLLEYLGFSHIILFGQDLGFFKNYTHAENSTSGRTVNKEEQLIEIESNSNNTIYTTPNLNSYLRWFNEKITKSKVKVYNTAYQGAKINKTNYLNEKEFEKIVSLAKWKY